MKAYPRRYIVTITPPTPNGDLHLGHLSGPFLAADICRRLLRQQGFDTLLLSYSDDYQSYMPRKARQLRKETFELARYNARQIKLSMEAAHIDIDSFIQAIDSRTFSRIAASYFCAIKRAGLMTLQATSVFECANCQVHGYEGWGRGHCNWCGASSDASQCEVCARVPDMDQMNSMRCILCNTDMSRTTVERHVWNIGAQYGAIQAALHDQPKRPALTAYLEHVLQHTYDQWPVTRPGDAGLEIDQHPDNPSIRGSWVWRAIELH